MVQTARAATMADTGWFKRMGCRYLIHDGDGKFCEHWKQTLRDAGIEPVQIPLHSPNGNAVAERWVLTVKREMVRRCWFLDFGGLRKALNEFISHYNGERPHQSKGNRPLTVVSTADTATQKSIAGFKASQFRCVTRCNGTVRHYYVGWQARLCPQTENATENQPTGRDPIGILLVRRLHSDGFWLGFRVVESQAAEGTSEKIGDGYLRSKQVAEGKP